MPCGSGKTTWKRRIEDENQQVNQDRWQQPTNTMAAYDSLADSHLHAFDVGFFGLEHFQDHCAVPAFFVSWGLALSYRDDAWPHPQSRPLHQLLHLVLDLDSRSVGGATICRAYAMRLLRFS
jgi:hypothetical protein